VRCEHKYPIFKKCTMFIPKSTYRKVLVSVSNSLHNSPCTRAAGSPPPPPPPPPPPLVQAIVFTSDSLSLIFNKPTHEEQNKISQTDRMRERTGPAQHGADRFVFVSILFLSPLTVPPLTLRAESVASVYPRLFIRAINI